MLEAAVLGGRTAWGGLLLGHKRGGRFIIEKAVPCGPGVFPGRNAYPRLAILFGDALVGFYSSSPPNRREPPPPFSVGKVFLTVKAGPRGLSRKAFLADYTSRFLWKPLKIVSLQGAGPHA